MPVAVWFILISAAWVAFAFLARALLDNPRAEPGFGLVWLLGRIYAIGVHRLRVIGVENIPKGIDAGPLIVVANHTAGVDPVLVQMPCAFEIRWLMAQDMRHPWGEWLWRLAGVIFVSRQGDEIAGVREAIRHLRDGGVIGVFPEGGIARPRGTVRPFLPGVGLLIKKSGAPVLPVVVEGTPDVDPAWDSIKQFSRSVVTFMPPIQYRGSGLGAAEIAEDLRSRFEGWIKGDPDDSALIGAETSGLIGPRGALRRPA
ncbi:MAG: lysophospholipid acyltransferase family protein [Phycisphaerales bacterium]